jgi:hypothetical protein
MSAADDVVFRRVERNRRTRFPTKSDFGGVGKREGIDPVDLGPGNVSNNDLRIGFVGHSAPFCATSSQREEVSP